MRITIAIGLAAAALLAACKPAEDDGGGDAGTETPAPAASTDDLQAPDAFAATAWRTTAEDGARYVTYLDPEGTYRDLRNGDPWQQGIWTYDEGVDGKALCFTPEDENGLERCWTPGPMEGETMTATNTAGRRIELERVDYAPPAEDDEAA